MPQDLADIQKILESGRDVNARDNEGQTLLIQAIESGIPAAVTFLLEHRASPNVKNAGGYTPLIAAVTTQTDSLSIIRSLLDAGADINGCDDRGWTPLMWAAQYDEIEVLRQLLQHGADPNARSDDGRSPLSIARRNEEFKQVLKQAGARGEP